MPKFDLLFLLAGKVANISEKKSEYVVLSTRRLKKKYLF
ncbi:Uncharacterized protein dnm_012620 [Desulfonema magnum]|uniref:Uncharacterized protein n=1 Tax=Desulfonema magnum TaxID=45655 RepID=A0A975GKZ7_9BACT|nr:Uncharacterized protein dnm_012620 [Desulfonema magnum]